MIFVGFGFLMTFLRHYSYSAVGFNFFASCLVMLEAILALGFTQQASDSPSETKSCCKALQPALEGGLHHSLVLGSCLFSPQSLAYSAADAPDALQLCTAHPCAMLPVHHLSTLSAHGPAGRAPSQDNMPSQDVA